MHTVFILSGPTGSGKDTLIEALGKQIDFERVITTTTRSMRPGEREGHPYYFLSQEKFEQAVSQGKFFEYSVNENDESYGVTYAEIERIKNLSKIVLWKVDWKGTVTIKKHFPEIRAILIVAPLEVMIERIRRRDGTNHSERYYAERLAYSTEWLKHQDIYDYIVENEEGKLAEAVTQVRAILTQSQTS